VPAIVISAVSVILISCTRPPCPYRLRIFYQLLLQSLQGTLRCAICIPSCLDCHVTVTVVVVYDPRNLKSSTRRCVRVPVSITCRHNLLPPPGPQYSTPHRMYCDRTSLFVCLFVCLFVVGSFVLGARCDFSKTISPIFVKKTATVRHLVKFYC